MKNLIQIFFAILTVTFSLFSQAHEGHAPVGVVHELHHMLWVLMALAVSGAIVFVLKQRSKSEDKSKD
ncbi:hypothetical protein PVT68_14860 [Microbulbifer bruguierae]|uniref:Uncharacterized protein n=1 Tax=Microbulbifer bruguierae TaxID=3029061 RepID=A0ABY8NCB0_9GAMM|nr:hypothetical protein [Microbulbifer bruguierae]WGL16044.1 hypothetical protein PVT68_14860 [Microbulbifer bruguierae]